MAIGVDIEDISRFDKKPQEFLDKLFTPLEQEYCGSKANPANHFAARFCAKEATFKALSSIGINQFSLKEIEIYNEENGCPRIRILNDNCKNIKFELSLSHDKTKAIAFVTIQQI